MNKNTRIVLGVLALFVVLGSCGCCLFLGWALAGGAMPMGDASDPRVAPIEAALATGGAPDPARLRELAAERDTRGPLYTTLRDHGRLDLFPVEHAAPESLAEATLAHWLVHPNELGAPPHAMQLAAIATLDDPSLGEVRYYAFRFAAPPGNWAADQGWLFGVSGPWPVSGFQLGGEEGGRTFSDFDGYSDPGFRQLVVRMHGGALRESDLRVETIPMR